MGCTPREPHPRPFSRKKTFFLRDIDNIVEGRSTSKSVVSYEAKKNKNDVLACSFFAVFPAFFTRGCVGSPVFIAVLIRNGPISAGQFRGQHLQRRAAGGIFFTFFVGARWGTFSKKLHRGAFEGRRRLAFGPSSFCLLSARRVL